MHSSRMRTVQCSGRLIGGGLPGGVLSREGCLPMGYVCLWEGVCLPRGVSVQGVCLPRGVYTSPACGQNP